MAEPAKNQRVLIVEESATLRYMLGKNIQKQGYDMLSVDSYESAIDTLQGFSQTLHAILLGWPNYEHFEDSRQEWQHPKSAQGPEYPW